MTISSHVFEAKRALRAVATLAKGGRLTDASLADLLVKVTGHLDRIELLDGGDCREPAEEYEVTVAGLQYAGAARARRDIRANLVCLPGGRQ